MNEAYLSTVNSIINSNRWTDDLRVFGVNNYCTLRRMWADESHMASLTVDNVR